MEYKKGKDAIIIRLDEGDEIITSLKAVCRKEKIKGGLISGIGAASIVELGSYNPKTKRYPSKRYEGHLEIVSLSGNVATRYGLPGPHMHAVIGLNDFSAKAGHLFRAVINPSCEILIIPLKTAMKRSRDEKSELFLLDFK